MILILIPAMLYIANQAVNLTRICRELFLCKIFNISEQKQPFVLMVELISFTWVFYKTGYRRLEPITATFMLISVVLMCQRNNQRSVTFSILLCFMAFLPFAEDWNPILKCMAKVMTEFMITDEVSKMCNLGKCLVVIGLNAIFLLQIKRFVLF